LKSSRFELLLSGIRRGGGCRTRRTTRWATLEASQPPVKAMATRRIVHSAYARIGFEYRGAMENTDAVALPSPAEMNPFLSIPSGGGAHAGSCGLGHEHQRNGRPDFTPMT
jgi:hypothetical protein